MDRFIPQLSPQLQLNAGPLLAAIEEAAKRQAFFLRAVASAMDLGRANRFLTDAGVAMPAQWTLGNSFSRNTAA